MRMQSGRVSPNSPPQCSTDRRVVVVAAEQAERASCRSTLRGGRGAASARESEVARPMGGAGGRATRVARARGAPSRAGEACCAEEGVARELVVQPVLARAGRRVQLVGVVDAVGVHAITLGLGARRQAPAAASARATTPSRCSSRTSRRSSRPSGSSRRRATRTSTTASTRRTRPTCRTSCPRSRSSRARRTRRPIARRRARERAARDEAAAAETAAAAQHR